MEDGSTLIIQFNEQNEGFLEWIREKLDGATDKACSGSEVPLRAFWCKVRIPLRGNPAKPIIKYIGAPRKPADFNGDSFNCDASCVYGKVNIS